MPGGPGAPVAPSGPFGPLSPRRPFCPRGPRGPVGPWYPVRPTSPSGPRNPLGPFPPGAPFCPTCMSMSTGMWAASSLSSLISNLEASAISLPRARTVASMLETRMHGHPPQGPKKVSSPTCASIVAAWALRCSGCPWQLQSQWSSSLMPSSRAPGASPRSKVFEYLSVSLSLSLISLRTDASICWNCSASLPRPPKLTSALMDA
mmetsp:Transcript_3830/g.8642  ORF Transcript_3830/g.8642 Transcript_3830/m.8642 type:complete len:205 (-) Transcript_3830:186-800(-)